MSPRWTAAAMSAGDGASESCEPRGIDPCHTMRAARWPSGKTNMVIARALLRWYDRTKRDLPWRRDPSPYRTLVSEFMLQQTVVATVEPFFARFIARFPDLASLAAATD